MGAIGWIIVATWGLGLGWIILPIWGTWMALTGCAALYGRLVEICARLDHIITRHARHLRAHRSAVEAVKRAL